MLDFGGILSLGLWLVPYWGSVDTLSLNSMPKGEGGM